MYLFEDTLSGNRYLEFLQFYLIPALIALYPVEADLPGAKNIFPDVYRVLEFLFKYVKAR